MTPGGSSKDPAARGRSIANLRRGGQTPDGSQRVTHGAFRRVVDAGDLDAKARTIFDALAADAPLRDPSGELPAADAVTVKLLADALVRLDDVADYLRRHGLEDAKGELRVSALDVERRLQATAADLAARLGMSPRARAQLGLDLARMMSAGDALDAHLRDRYGEGDDV
jgi:hypothetical protein